MHKIIQEGMLVSKKLKCEKDSGIRKNKKFLETLKCKRWKKSGLEKWDKLDQKDENSSTCSQTVIYFISMLSSTKLS